jgi:hypothetical protein
MSRRAFKPTAEQRGWFEAMIGYACRKPKFVCGGTVSFRGWVPYAAD